MNTPLIVTLIFQLNRSYSLRFKSLLFNFIVRLSHQDSEHELDENAEADLRGARPPLMFAITCFFCNHYEELQTVLYEVKLITNNAPLTYVYRNTIEVCLTPNHLLFGRQLTYKHTTCIPRSYKSNRSLKHY